jgi:membrane-bound ClpP family serine protease
MVWWYGFGILLYLGAAGLLTAEMSKPSKGIKAIAALAFVIGGVAIFFRQSIVMGWVGIGVAAVMIPTVVIIAWKISLKKHRGG